MNFVELAVRTAGQTTLLLGWLPDDFWNATPAELATILAALSPRGDAADGTTLTQLMKAFPDG